MDINWGTVSTSLVTSGGILFAAYKLWFQRRLEDHKCKLQNNTKLFELELECLSSLGKINQEIQFSTVGFTKESPSGEIFLTQSSFHAKTLQQFVALNSHMLDSTTTSKISDLIGRISNLVDEACPYESKNKSRNGGIYPCFENLPELLEQKAQNLKIEIHKTFEEYKNIVFSRAGR